MQDKRKKALGSLPLDSSDTTCAILVATIHHCAWVLHQKNSALAVCNNVVLVCGWGLPYCVDQDLSLHFSKRVSQLSINLNEDLANILACGNTSSLMTTLAAVLVHAFVAKLLMATAMLQLMMCSNKNNGATGPPPGRTCFCDSTVLSISRA